MIGQTVSHYHITRKLGAGGMGVVYEAEDLKLKRSVALKFLSPELTRNDDAKARFIHEAQAAASLSHPNIATVFEIGETDGQLFISMEYVMGESLKEKIARGPLKLEEVERFVEQITLGLQAAHEQGIVHRDIKPGNIMVTPKGQVKITDFGLAFSAETTRITKTGSTLGTAAYMSPEQVRGQDLDSRTDLWALGVVFYEMLTGTLPFRAEAEPAVIYHILNSTPDPVTDRRKDADPELISILDRCLAKDITSRYQSADELHGDLVQLPGISTGAWRGTQRISFGFNRFPRIIRWPLRLALAAAVIFVIWSGSTFIRRSGPSSAGGPIMLAVLPFANLGVPEDDGYCAGITDVITARLAGIRGLGVVSRQSTLPYRESELPLKEIGHSLGVEYVLEGTVQRTSAADDGIRVRIVSQLIRVEDDLHIWADTFDEFPEHIFDAQTSIARRIAFELDINLLTPSSFGSVESLVSRESALEQARLSIAAGLVAYDREPRDRNLARGLFDNAIRYLTSCGLLGPDVREGEALESSFRMALGDAAAAELADRDFSRILASLEVTADTRAGDRPSYDLTAELTSIFAEFGVNLVQKPLPPDLVQWVEEGIHLYTNDWRDFTEKTFARARTSLPLVYQELEKHNLPSALAAVPFIQTGYGDDIVAKSGAAGLWRFMPQTARDYGLVVDLPDRDDRMDPYLHTVAACQHFDYLLKLFGSSSPLCALTAYSAGAGGLSRCLAAESDWRSPWRYWDLVEKEAECLSDESAEFVPRFLAAAVVMRRPDAFGLGE